MGTLHEYFGARQATDDNVMGSMHCACWMTEGTDPHSEYVMLNGNSGFAHTSQCYICTYIVCLGLHIKQLFTYTLYNMTQYNYKSCFIHKTQASVLNIDNCVILETVYTHHYGCTVSHMSTYMLV
jgi:hypothetical protein